MDLNNNAFLWINNLYKEFEDFTAVNNVSFDVNKGELVSILGPSGCGKTTLLKMIGGFIQPDRGEIFLDGKEIGNITPNLRDTCMVFQNYALFPHMTVAENIGFGLKIRKVPKKVIQKKVIHLLKMVQMETLSERKPGELSGGQQQRVALARALSLNPKILLLDEPFSSLDANLRQSMQTKIRTLHKKLGLTIIFVTHDQEEAMSISDRIVVMKRGEICQTGTPTEIYHKPLNPFVAGFVGTANIFHGVVEYVDSRSDTLHVKTELGSVRVDYKLNGLIPGDTVDLLARPETIDIEVADSQREDTNSVFARIDNRMFTGSHIRYQLDIGTEMIVADRISSSKNNCYSENNTVKITLPRDMHVIKHARAQQSHRTSL